MTTPETETIHHDLNPTEWALVCSEKDRANSIMETARQLVGKAQSLLPSAYKTILSTYKLSLTSDMKCDVDPDTKVLTAVVLVPEGYGHDLLDDSPDANLDLLEHDRTTTNEDIDGMLGDIEERQRNIVQQNAAAQKDAPTEEQCST